MRTYLKLVLAALVCIALCQFFYWGKELFPLPKKNTLTFPNIDDTFSPLLPVLKTGSIPKFPEADIILSQPYLYAPGIVLQDADLNGVNLSVANLSFADLRHADLRNTNLSQALLYGARLDGALFNNNTLLPFSKSSALKMGMKEAP